jgi:glycosyltransferase involved in cell wall biosynthesis
MGATAERSKNRESWSSTHRHYRSAAGLTTKSGYRLPLPVRRVRLPGEWDDLVVICAANSWDAIRFQDRHIAEQLVRRGPVLYVDPPLSRLTPLHHPELRSSLARPRLRLVAPSLARLTPVVLPRPQRTGMVVVTTRLMRRSLRRATLALGASVRAVVASSPLVNTFGACGEKLTVYWAQDDYVAGADLFGLSANRIRRGEARVVAQAEMIVASSEHVAEMWRSRGRDPVLIPFGCDHELFAGSDDAPVPTDVRLSPPIAGFIGHLADRIDISLLEAVAVRGRSVLLVGPRHPGFALERIERLLNLPNVQWVGPKPFDQLPSYQRVIDVGLVPYTDSAFNQASFPLKTLEYLSSGRPVVATDLPATRWLGTDLVTIARGPEAFAAAVDRHLGEARTAELVARRRSFAAAHSWATRAADWARVLGWTTVQPRTGRLL